MPQMNKRLDRNLSYYDMPVENRYIDYLIETGDALLIDNLVVDVPQIIRRRFVCHTRQCIGDKNVKNLRGLSCCSSFDVRVSPEEIKQIEKILPDVRRRYPTIDAAIREKGGRWWHYGEDDFNKTLETKENGGCVFLTPREDGVYKCSLHAVALEKKIDTLRHKPSVCGMFPLFLIEIDNSPYDYLLTCTSEDTRHVTNDDGDYHPFDCLCPVKNLATRPLYQEMGNVITAMFGKKVFEAIDAEAQRRKSNGSAPKAGLARAKRKA